MPWKHRKKWRYSSTHSQHRSQREVSAHSMGWAGHRTCLDAVVKTKSFPYRDFFFSEVLLLFSLWTFLNLCLFLIVLACSSFFTVQHKHSSRRREFFCSFVFCTSSLLLSLVLHFACTYNINKHVPGRIFCLFVCTFIRTCFFCPHCPGVCLFVLTVQHTRHKYPYPR